MNIKLVRDVSPFQIKKEKNLLLGITWDWESARQGARYFPTCFRQAGLALGPSFFHDRRVHIQDIGNICLEPKDTSKSFVTIRNCAATLFEENNKMVFLGGDHSITIPIVEAINKKLVVVIFDAHADALQNKSAPLSEQVLAILCKKHNVEKVVVIGCRSGSKEFKNKKVFFEDIENTYKGVMSKELTKILDRSNGVYVSFDFDVIDPLFISEVSYPQPLGIDPKTAVKLLNLIINKKTVGIDFVEFNPNVNEKVSNSMHNAIEIILSATEKLGN